MIFPCERTGERSLQPNKNLAYRSTPQICLSPLYFAQKTLFCNFQVVFRDFGQNVPLHQGITSGKPWPG